MNGIAEVREEYKQAVRQHTRNPTEFYEGRMSGLEAALSCLGVDDDKIREMYETCEEEVLDERAQEDIGPGDVSYDEEGFVIEQEELDAIERPVAQAQVEADDKLTLEHIRARFASPATSADIRNAVQAFEEGFKELEVRE